ncbi:MAG TPA: hypothetical protein VIA18_01715 [Polyangia bacterium]|nr:hypothetical protein [Polyangia bacterium]
MSIQQSDIESALERYCGLHENAADSVDGVRRWWLANPALPRDVVQAALDALVARGVLAARRLPDGTQVYFARARG